MADQFEAVHSRHDQIRDDDVGVESQQALQRFLAVGSDLRLKITIGEHRRQGRALPFIVIDDQNPAGKRRRSWHFSHFSSRA